MALELVQGDFEAFFATPFHAYAKDTPYVSPMRSDLKKYLDAAQNPLMKAGSPLEFYVVKRDGKPVARATAHRHLQSNARYGWARTCFGFFDAADDAEAIDLLFSAIEDFAKRHGDTEIMGPFNLTAMQMVGLVTEGFEHAPYTDMVWSPEWLPKHLERLGYGRKFPMATWQFNPQTVPDEQPLTDKARAILDSPDWSFAPITRRDFKVRMEEGRLCLNDGFDTNPMFVPLTAEEFQFQAGEMMWVMDPNLSAILHYKGKPAGVVICIPDLNPFVKHAGARYGLRMIWSWLRGLFAPKRAVIILYSVMPEHQGKGVNAALLHRVLGALKKGGYQSCGGTWIADVNDASLAQLKRLNAQVLHRTHLFRKALA
ncbi:GNAT family N-acetyltransferase [Brevundimonas sp.]|uniref:GNAT family N-acetyltransferase n=1 Tax=Brevundimonas sp. TaxID=1871086 RepID=UPI0028A099B5|nr:GNAT family N-acetyltransferase [Brevundimonas sp.]